MSNISILKLQKKYINSLNFNNKNRYISVDILNNYFKNPDKLLAEQIFWSTIDKKLKNN